MTVNVEAPRIVALIYSDSEAADDVLRAAALQLSNGGWRLAGLVQHNRPRAGRSRCDMMLEVLGSGELVAISRDRGAASRGCVLVLDRLIHAMQIVRASVADQPDLLILNKFGKAESEGGGFRPLIAEAVEAGVPLLIAVPYRNLDNWRTFCGSASTEVLIGSNPNPVVELLKQLGMPEGRAAVWPRPSSPPPSPGTTPSRPSRNGAGSPIS